MAKIIALIGCSSSGKDTIFKSVNAIPVVSTTNRPIRKDTETNGIDYHFITYPEINQMLINGVFIESRCYYTKQGLWIYGVTKDAIDLDSNDTYKVILDIKGLRELTNYCDKKGKKHIITSIFIDVSEAERIVRSYKRQKHEMTDEIELEILRRLDDDSVNVEPYKNECCMVLKNEEPEDLENCVNFINQYIKAIQNK